MNKFKTILLSLLVSTSSVALAQTGKSTEKLRRADCFFGVHFDLHASEDIADAGKTLTPEMIDTFLTKVHPDFIQIDCKGHPGISSYPTKVGYHVKGFEKNPLKLFREVTEKNKVALFMHYSGVWDSKIVAEHPDWALIQSNGEQSTMSPSFFSPYLDTYMIPQLKELSDYGVDGAWIDGECWAVTPDFGEASLTRFTKETGITEMPRKPSDIYYPEFIGYTRNLFRERMKKYVDAIHQYNPDFQITSNWAYSSMMPEKVTVNLDFLSGDLTSMNGVYRAAFEARCLAPQGKPWDLMAWGFSWDGKEMPMNIKSSVQLEQELAEVMAMGGGVQVYYQQNRDLSLKPWLANSISEIAAFCRERQIFCHKAKAVPQIALLYPTKAHYKKSSAPFDWSSITGLQGALNALLDGQQTVEILMEHHLTGKMAQYPLIVIPECDYLEPSFMGELRTYLQNGGNMLVIGCETAGLFARELGIRSSEKTEVKSSFISASNHLGAISSSFLSVDLAPESKPLSCFYDICDYRYPGKMVASSVCSYGKGKIAGIYFNAGSAYLKYKSPVLRDFVNDLTTELFPNPLVKVVGSHLVHVAVNKINIRMYANLVNIAGENANQDVIGYDEIPSLKDLTVQINTVKEPTKIVLQPAGKELKIDFHDGVSKVIVPDLPIHSILEIIP